MSSSTFGSDETARVDLRSKRKAATRSALYHAAIELFAEVGYEAATVSQIAQRAEVGERTFFVHFPSKEDVLFSLSGDDITEMRLMVSKFGLGVSDLDVLERVVAQQHHHVDVHASHEMSRLLVRAATSSSTIRGKQLDYSEALAEAAARGLAERRGLDHPDQQTSMLADLVIRVLYHTIIEWTESAVESFDDIWAKRMKMFRGSLESDAVTSTT